MKVAEDIDEVEPLLEFEAATRHLGHYTPYRSNSVYAYDFRDQSLALVVPEQIESKGSKGEKIFCKKIQFKPGLLYVEALNFRLAQERVKRGKFIILNK